MDDPTLFITIALMVIAVILAGPPCYDAFAKRQVSLEIDPWGIHKGRRDGKHVESGSIDLPPDFQQSYIDFKLTNSGEQAIRIFKVVIYEPSWKPKKRKYGSYEVGETLQARFTPGQVKHAYVYISEDGQTPFPEIGHHAARIKVKVGWWWLQSKTFWFDKLVSQS
ncbi:MAG: hypothetical protein ABSD58_17835 [Verrucomicrobiia bacterium]|jgi:hypothetical protein